MVFSIKVNRPQSTAGRCWNVAQDVLSTIVVFTPIVLKLTGVITWSWWSVLSPIWISAVLLVLVVLGLAVLVGRGTKRQACLEMERVATEILVQFAPGAGNQDAPGGGPGRQDEQG
jgi:hypothetical protein